MHELDKAMFEVFTGAGGTIAANLKPYLSLVLEIYGAFEIISRFIQWRKRYEKKRNLERSLALTFQKKLDRARNDLENWRTMWHTRLELCSSIPLQYLHLNTRKKPET